MSTSPDTGANADDRLVTLISRWLARHLGDEELARGLAAVDASGLSEDQAEALDELRAELDNGRRGAGLEMVARETLEALALGG
jgi:hypothetical protein